jgi:hypothetical protein
MRYLKGIVDYGLKYVVDNEISLLGYSDSNWVGSVVNKKKYIRMLLHFLGSGMISWISKKNSCVALNMDEVEYVAACETSHEAVWL